MTAASSCPRPLRRPPSCRCGWRPAGRGGCSPTPTRRRCPSARGIWWRCACGVAAMGAWWWSRSRRFPRSWRAVRWSPCSPGSSPPRWIPTGATGSRRWRSSATPACSAPSRPPCRLAGWGRPAGVPAWVPPPRPAPRVARPPLAGRGGGSACPSSPQWAAGAAAGLPAGAGGGRSPGGAAGHRRLFARRPAGPGAWWLGGALPAARPVRGSRRCPRGRPACRRPHPGPAGGPGQDRDGGPGPEPSALGGHRCRQDRGVSAGRGNGPPAGQRGAAAHPEIGLIPQLLDRCRERFGERVLEYHSGLGGGRAGAGLASLPGGQRQRRAPAGGGHPLGGVPSGAAPRPAGAR